MPEPVPKKAMKVKCVRLLDAFGREVASSPWLTLGRIYHVVTVEIDATGKRRYGLVTSEKAGEWPSMGEHQAECFELVSATVPSNWRSKIDANGTISIAPGAWSLSELLCVRHKLMAKEPRYATQTQGRSAGRTGQGLEPGPGT
ncbi:hypothetical protein LGN13_28410, partial [Burkholderia multivorans]|nr:hypothetical protein [Burkholderia multivorans]MDN8084142.1 hypothetical protein [Burkholderia multivorans]